MSVNVKTLLDTARQIIPPLSHEFHKGQAGRVGVIGGSEDYTGAPYFSAISALKLGADMAHIVCETSAAVPIKSYSPDLMVHPYMRKTEKNITQTPQEIAATVSVLLPRFHVVVVGPGLSRDKTMLESAKEIVSKARERDLPIVLDADALMLVQRHPDIIKGYSSAILTPNLNEFKRLCEAMEINFDDNYRDDMVRKLSQALGGVTIVQKGKCDLISNGEKVYKCDNPSGLKRCGGQGDILTGIIATFAAWGKAYQNNLWQHDQAIASSDLPILASSAGCTLVRECSRAAFERHGRSVQTSDMIQEIGPTFRKFFERQRL